MNRKLVVATRRSALALAQTRAFVARLCELEPSLQVSELQVTTQGDRVLDRSLAEIGGKGLFVKELEQALLDREADFAVHSMKDLPAELAEGLVLGCVPLREDPRDVLIGQTAATLTALPRGAKVGSSSLRRAIQIRLERPDLEVLPLRGNVDTRIRRLREGVVDAIMLAHAGLRRLGLAAEVTELLSPERCLPAVGQGALGIECRGSDSELLERLARLTDAETLLAVSAERALLRAVDGNCQVPVAAYADRMGAELRLRGLLAEPDGSLLRRVDQRVPWPTDVAAAVALGTQLGVRLREKP